MARKAVSGKASLSLAYSPPLTLVDPRKIKT
jgi:hypothetical protein